MRKIILASLLLMIACHNGSCDFGLTDEYGRCSRACAPRVMKSFRPGNGGCQPAECLCDDVLAPPADAGK